MVMNCEIEQSILDNLKVNALSKPKKPVELSPFSRRRSHSFAVSLTKSLSTLSHRNSHRDKYND